MAKGSESLFLAIGEMMEGRPYRVVSGTITDVKFETLRWSGQGDDMKSEELTGSECYTSIEVSWVGGNQKIKFPPSLGDLSDQIEDGSFVVCVMPQKSKRGQMKDDPAGVEVLGLGHSIHDANFEGEIARYPGNTRPRISTAA